MKQLKNYFVKNAFIRIYFNPSTGKQGFFQLDICPSWILPWLEVIVKVIGTLSTQTLLKTMPNYFTTFFDHWQTSNQFFQQICNCPFYKKMRLNLPRDLAYFFRLDPQFVTLNNAYSVARFVQLIHFVSAQVFTIYVCFGLLICQSCSIVMLIFARAYQFLFQF